MHGKRLSRRAERLLVTLFTARRQSTAGSRKYKFLGKISAFGGVVAVVALMVSGMTADRLDNDWANQ